MSLAGRNFGHIHVGRILGQGGMGDVYEGFDERLARPVALKVLNSVGQMEAEARARLIREARTLSKLDHPNICRIYDIIDDHGADVLMLELIDGRTLQEAVNAGLSGAEKLRIACDVASVLVAAHRAGIVHRDLKPDNVMLTKSGEVKVLDFGLARWTKRKSGSFPAMPAVAGDDVGPRLHVVGDPDATAVYDAVLDAATSDGHAAATAHGLTVGTPLYMSPEQARGEPLTTASDIYSFGLVLQTMFTGAEPYPEGLTARQVMVRAATGDSLPILGVRRDVAALIKWCKALAPSDRPTAGDALRRIERIVDAPKRIVRRAAAVALLALAFFSGWKYTTDLRRERTAAQIAAAEAKQRRAQADSLIGFMLGDLRTKLEPVGKLDILDSVAERSLSYMSSLDPKTLTAEELARNSKALYQMAEVRIAQGRLPDATAALTESLRLAKAAADRAPNDERFRLELGTAHYWLGQAMVSAGDLPNALLHYNEYRNIAEDLWTHDSTNPTYAMERAYSHGNVGSVLEMQGKLREALSEYELALSIKQDQLRLDAANTRLQADVAVTINKIGNIRYKRGDLRAARDAFDEETATYRALLAHDPKQTVWQERLATACAYRGRVLADIGDLQDAVATGREELAMEERLVALDPQNANWSRNLASGMARLGALLSSTGDGADSIRYLTGCAARLRELLRRPSALAAWRRDLAAAEMNHARALLGLGAAASARPHIEAALTELEAMKQPDSVTRMTLAAAYVVSGDVDAAEGRADDASRRWSQAISILDAVIAGTDEPRPLNDRFHALARLGRTAEACRDAARLSAIGYGAPDFVAARGKIHCPGV